MGAKQASLFTREQRLRVRRLRDFAQRTPLSSAISLFSAIVLFVTLFDCIPLAPGLSWFAAILAVNWGRVVQARSFAADTIDLGHVVRNDQLAHALSYTDALCWALGLSMFTWCAGPQDMPLVTVTASGLLIGLLLNFRPLPRIGAAVALAYMVAGAIAALASGDFVNDVAAMVMGAFALVVGYCIAIDAADYERRFWSELELEESADTIRLLLRDYEAESADWLWQIDQAGCLRDVCARFADAAGCEPEALEGRELAGLFKTGPARELLSRRLLLRESFRDLTLEFDVGGKSRWWTLAARSHPSGAMHGVARDVTEARETEARVAYMAHHDVLTGLANRFLFGETLRDTLTSLRRSERAALLYLDLDKFKSINDTLGHSIGDLLLIEAAGRIANTVKKHDLVARLGGDEFAVLLTRFSERQDAVLIAERIVQAMNEPFLIEGQKLSISTSVGVAHQEGPGGSPDDLLRRADLALYAAKGRGRACHAEFEISMEDKERERTQLEADLRIAVREGQFALYFQPLIRIVTNEIVGFETLVRWEHPRFGVVMPGEFIPIAEDTGLIMPLGEWIIRNAIAEAARWPDKQRVAINLSPLQMRSPRLVPTVLNAIAETGIDPTRIELEITESVLMHDNEANVALLHRLRELGLRISLDDFGTGYSSLNYLRSFPFDKIKIDKCFVRELETREDCRAIIRAITSLASALGMETTAEGVEREDQLNWLRDQGCTEVQGYLTGRPMPAAAAAALITGGMPTSEAIPGAKE